MSTTLQVAAAVSLLSMDKQTQDDIWEIAMGFHESPPEDQECDIPPPPTEEPVWEEGQECECE